MADTEIDYLIRIQKLLKEWRDQIEQDFLRDQKPSSGFFFTCNTPQGPYAAVCTPAGMVQAAEIFAVQQSPEVLAVLEILVEYFQPKGTPEARELTAQNHADKIKTHLMGMAHSMVSGVNKGKDMAVLYLADYPVDGPNNGHANTTEARVFFSSQDTIGPLIVVALMENPVLAPIMEKAIAFYRNTPPLERNAIPAHLRETVRIIDDMFKPITANGPEV